MREQRALMEIAEKKKDKREEEPDEFMILDFNYLYIWLKLYSLLF